MLGMCSVMRRAGHYAEWDLMHNHSASVALMSILESLCTYLTLAPLGRQLGDWYAAARIAGAPVPPPAVMSRATTVQVRLSMCCACWSSRGLHPASKRA